MTGNSIHCNICRSTSLPLISPKRETEDFMFETVAVILVVLIAGLLAYTSTRPDTFRVQRATTIKAPPETIFALINDLHRWTVWSPWEKKDPAMKRTHSGAPNGKGAAYAWDGNTDVGKGRMEIIESLPPRKVVIKLDFEKPFEGHNRAEFTLEPKGGVTTVIWAMYGPVSLMMKLMHVFFDMDRMIGKDFEAGLADLKAAAEK